MSADIVVHESSYVDDGAEVGAGSHVWHFSHVMRGARVGRNCTIGQNVFIGEGVRLGDNVKVQNNTSVYSGVTVEDDVFLGPSVVFTNVATPRSHVSRREEFVPTIVRRGAAIGANVTVVCGVTLGHYAMVGAGAVVTHDVPDYALAYGNPAEVRGWVCSCGERIEFYTEVAECRRCGARYELRDGVPHPVGGDT